MAMESSCRLPPLSQEEKQERQRMHVRRSYYKKRNFVQSLRDQVIDLEQQYAAVLAAQPEKALALQSMAITTAARPPQAAPLPLGNGSPTVVSEFLLAEADLGGSSPNVPASSNAIQLFMQVSQLRDSLRDENDQLKKTLTRYANFVRRVQQSRDDATSDEFCLVDRAEATDVHASLSHVEAIDVRLTVEQCREIQMRARREIRQHMGSDNCSTTGVSVFGWRDRRRVVDQRVQFSIQKCYTNQWVGDMAEASWALFTDPARFAAMYSSHMPIDLQIIQRVDDDNVVFYRRITKLDGTATLKSIFLATRFRTETGFVMHFRSCASDTFLRQQELLREISRAADDGSDEKNEVWQDVCSWLVFEAHGELHEHAKFTFGGSIDIAVATPEFWILEVLLISLRWEARIVGPVFSLCPSS